MEADVELHQILVLEPGQLYWFQGRPADRIALLAGCGHLIEPPQWLAEHMLVARHPLVAGEVRALGCRGWFALEAETRVRLVLEPVAPWHRRLAGWLVTRRPMGSWWAPTVRR